MKALVVLAHPQEGSLNHAIAQRAVQRLQQQGHEVVFHDLYAEGFDPLLKGGEAGREVDLESMVRQHVDDLTSADAIVIVHPNWWGQPPAMMKGWIDRVFRAGVVYRFEDTGGGVGRAVGQLKARTAVVFNTSNTPMNVEWGSIDPLEEMWRNTVLGMCGVQDVRRRLFAPVMISTEEQRAGWLEEVDALLDDLYAHATAGV